MNVTFDLNENMIHAYQAARQRAESFDGANKDPITKEQEKRAKATYTQSAKALLASINEQLDTVI